MDIEIFGTNRVKNRSGSRGFTIVELLIVIVVIAILATITIVAYNGVQERARTTAVSSALNQAAKKLKLYEIDNGTYPVALTDVAIADSSNTSYQYTANNTVNPKTFCITATYGSTSGKVTESTAPTSGGCNGHTWEGGVVMTNLVTNGDFSGGTTGWTTGNGTMSAVDGAAQHVGNGTGIFNPFYQSVPTPASLIGHKIYTRAKVKSLAGVPSRVSFYQTGGIAQITQPLTENVWTFLSAILTPTVATGSFYVTSQWPDAATQLGKTFQVDDVVELDLTATFGAGNEPTKTQMDTIMQQFPNSWFDGTVTADTQGVL